MDRLLFHTQHCQNWLKGLLCLTVCKAVHANSNYMLLELEGLSHSPMLWCWQFCIDTAQQEEFPNFPPNLLALQPLWTVEFILFNCSTTRDVSWKDRKGDNGTGVTYCKRFLQTYFEFCDFLHVLDVSSLLGSEEPPVQTILENFYSASA